MKKQLCRLLVIVDGTANVVEVLRQLVRDSHTDNVAERSNNTSLPSDVSIAISRSRALAYPFVNKVLNLKGTARVVTIELQT